MNGKHVVEIENDQFVTTGAYELPDVAQRRLNVAHAKAKRRIDRPDRQPVPASDTIRVHGIEQMGQ